MGSCHTFYFYSETIHAIGIFKFAKVNFVRFFKIFNEVKKNHVEDVQAMRVKNMTIRKIIMYLQNFLEL